MIGKVGRNVSRVFYGDGNAVGGDDMGILMNFAYRTNRHEYLPAWRLWAPPALERTTMTRYHVMPRLCLCLGQQGQEWFCLNCVEALFHRSNNNVRQNDVIGYDPRFQALFSIVNWILADERTCNDYPGCFSPDVPYRYGLELWKAVKLGDQSRFDGGTLMLHCPDTAQVQPCDLFLGDDGESRYLYEEARDLDYTFPNGVSIKTVMRAADVRGKLLREVLGFARDLIARKGTVAPTPKHQNRHHIGGASMSDYTVAELAIWNSPDNELNPNNARNRRHGATSASTSAANSAMPTNISKISRMRSRRPGHQTTHPNRATVDRGTSESQPNSSSAAVQAPEVASNESTGGASDQDTEHRGDDDTTAASSNMTESNSNITENTPPTSSTAPIIATSTTASPEAISNDIGSGTPVSVSNEPPASPPTPSPTTPIIAPTPPPQSLKRALDLSPLSPITPPTTDIYELVAREREVWMGLEEGNEAKRQKRDGGVL